jgi:hypothetical protein
MMIAQSDEPERSQKLAQAAVSDLLERLLAPRAA